MEVGIPEIPLGVTDGLYWQIVGSVVDLMYRSGAKGEAQGSCHLKEKFPVSVQEKLKERLEERLPGMAAGRPLTFEVLLPSSEEAWSLAIKWTFLAKSSNESQAQLWVGPSTSTMTYTMRLPFLGANIGTY